MKVVISFCDESAGVLTPDQRWGLAVTLAGASAGMWLAMSFALWLEMQRSEKLK